jgi:hypothetical protein
MIDCPDHMLLNRADRYTELPRDVTETTAFETTQNEDDTGAFWQRQKGSRRGVKIFFPGQDALRVKPILPVSVGVETDMQVGMAGEAPPRTVGEHARCGLPHIAAKVVDGRRAVPGNDTDEDILYKILDLTVVANTASKKSGEPTSHGFRLGRELRMRRLMLVAGFHPLQRLTNE